MKIHADKSSIVNAFFEMKEWKIDLTVAKEQKPNEALQIFI